jgi:hypothetical protein
VVVAVKEDGPRRWAQVRWGRQTEEEEEVPVFSFVATALPVFM